MPRSGDRVRLQESLTKASSAAGGMRHARCVLQAG